MLHFPLLYYHKGFLEHKEKQAHTPPPGQQRTGEYKKKK